MIEVENLTKIFGEITAVNNVSFKVQKGELTGFLGPNGAGKSTTLKIIATYMACTSGKILINGSEINECQLLLNQKETYSNQKKMEIDVRKIIGYLPELNPLYNYLLVFDYLKYIAELKEIKKKYINERILYVAERCGIKDRLSQMIGTLSKGFRQRVGLASAILSDPQILILDEPTVGLDPNQIQEIRALINELGKDKTVILSSHILSDIQAICDRILIMHKGKIVSDKMKNELLSEFDDSLENAFSHLTCCEQNE